MSIFREAASALFGALFGGAVLTSSAVAADDNLLVPFRGPQPPTVATDAATVAQRVVSLDFGAPAGLTAAAAAARAKLGATVTLKLSPTATVTLKRTSTSVGITGSQIWTGTDTDRRAKGTLVLKNGRLTGQVIVRGRYFDINPVNTSTAHVVREFRPAKLPKTSVTDPLKRAKKIGGGGTTTGTEITLLVGYTDAAYGNGNNIAQKIELAVSLANQVFTASKVGIKYKLVGTYWVENYDETQDVEQVPGGRNEETGEEYCPSEFKDSQYTAFDFQRNLYYARLGCGYLSPLLAKRKSLKADLVTLVVNRSELCGYYYGPGFATGYATGPVSAGYAFSVVSASCLSAYGLTRATAGNMGISKDRYVTSPVFKGNYAFGYVDLVGKFRDVTSEPDRCEAAGIDCSFVPRFSNPDQTYNRRPFGVEAGAINSADAARALEEYKATVAAFR